MQAPDIAVVRAAPTRMEMRADGDDGMPTMVIPFSRFNNWYEVDSLWEGTFMERTVPGAFADTIREDRSGVKVLYDHGFDPQIGNKVLGPIEDLREDKTSPIGEVPLFDTTYNRDLLPGLRAGVYGSSFRFRVTAEEWDDEPKVSKTNPKGLPERTITKVRLFEFGPVTFPANPESTVDLRCMTDQYYDRLRQRDTHAYDEAVRAAGVHLPDLTGRSDARSTDGGDPDVEPKDGDASTSPIPLRVDPDGDSLRLRGILR